MKVVISFPPEAEGAITTDALGEAGEEYEIDFSQVIVEPFFFSPKSSPTVCYLQVQDEKGKSVHNIVLKVSGATGRLSVTDRTRRVKSQLDEERYEKKGSSSK